MISIRGHPLTKNCSCIASRRSANAIGGTARLVVRNDSNSGMAGKSFKRGVDAKAVRDTDGNNNPSQKRRTENGEADTSPAGMASSDTSGDSTSEPLRGQPLKDFVANWEFRHFFTLHLMLYHLHGDHLFRGLLGCVFPALQQCCKRPFDAWHLGALIRQSCRHPTYAAILT
jgi:hypothetical protein